MLLFGSFAGSLIEIVISVLTIVYVYYRWSFQYWQRRRFPYLEPHIPFGNVDNQFKLKANNGIRLKMLYDEVKTKGWKHSGMYFALRPMYLVVDLDYVKNILTKDFQYFTDRGVYYNEENDPLSANLFAIGGTKWRNLRTKLTPTFTSGKMKMMFQMLLDCEASLLDKIDEEIAKKQAIDIKEVLGCFTTDIIGSVAFGLDFNSSKEDDSLFRKYGRKTLHMDTFVIIKLAFGTIFPNFGRALGVRITYKDASDFFLKLVRDTVDYREKNNVTRADFMQLLIDLKNNKLAHDEGYKHDGKTLTIEEIAAQSFLFFLAGFETSSTTMAFALYELARHQDLQQKVRDEINVVLTKHDGKITYEAIQELKYMDQVINETLRMYPPLPFVTRECVKDYKLPEEDLVVEKGTHVVIPIYGIHYDRDFYPDPEEFDPERFNGENKSTRHNHAHLPFGEGPRNCIGMRFGMMQTKVGLTSLLKKYKLTVNKKTAEPLKMKISSFILAAEGEIWLDAQKI